MPMSIRKFEPNRSVEIIAPRYGSGYRIGGRLLLTVAHLLDNVGSYCEVRDKRSFGQEKAQVIWKAQGLDLALIELPEGVEGVEAIALGKLPEGKTGEKIAFQMYGYPGWGWTQRDQGAAASGLQIEGTIYLADTSPDGLLVLRIDENLASEYSAERVIQAIKEDSRELKSEWRGMSGAAIICDGLVVAVQKQHPRPMQPNRVEATPLWMIYADEQWRQLIKTHGINPELEIVCLPSAERSEKNVKATSNRVMLVRSKALENRLKVLQEDYEAIFNQLSYTWNVVDQNKLKRQLDSIEQEMNELASELDKLNS